MPFLSINTRLHHLSKDANLPLKLSTNKITMECTGCRCLLVKNPNSATADSTGPTQALNSINTGNLEARLFSGLIIGGVLLMGMSEYWKPKTSGTMITRLPIIADCCKSSLTPGYVQVMMASFSSVTAGPHERKNRNANFTQIQLGYSLNLFAGNKVSNDGKNE